MRVTTETWEMVLTRDQGYCRYCNVDLLSSQSSFLSATVDHLVAVSEGGNDDPENLVLSCPACNHMLSRSGNLKTFEERKSLTDLRRKERWAWYRPHLDALRGNQDRTDGK